MGTLVEEHYWNELQWIRSVLNNSAADPADQKLAEIRLLDIGADLLKGEKTKEFLLPKEGATSFDRRRLVDAIDRLLQQKLLSAFKHGDFEAYLKGIADRVVLKSWVFRFIAAGLVALLVVGAALATAGIINVNTKVVDAGAILANTKALLDETAATTATVNEELKKKEEEASALYTQLDGFISTAKDNLRSNTAVMDELKGTIARVASGTSKLGEFEKMVVSFSNQASEVRTLLSRTQTDLSEKTAEIANINSELEVAREIIKGGSADIWKRVFSPTFLGVPVPALLLCGLAGALFALGLSAAVSWVGRRWEAWRRRGAASAPSADGVGATNAGNFQL